MKNTVKLARSILSATVVAASIFSMQANANPYADRQYQYASSSYQYENTQYSNGQMQQVNVTMGMSQSVGYQAPSRQQQMRSGYRHQQAMQNNERRRYEVLYALEQEKRSIERSYNQSMQPRAVVNQSYYMNTQVRY